MKTKKVLSISEYFTFEKSVAEMKMTLVLFLFFFSFILQLQAQTDLTVAVDFHSKTTDAETIKLFPLLDEQQKIVVIDFFSVTCGPCQTYAPDFQSAYELFGSNNGNVFFIGINYNGDNEEVEEFDSIFGLTFPSVSGLQGGGDIIYEAFNIMSYPTVIVITTDHQIVEQFIWPPSVENIVNTVYAHGGIITGQSEFKPKKNRLKIFPNPVNFTCNLLINSDDYQIINFEIYQLNGNLLYRSENNILLKGGNQVEVPVEILENGIYFVKIFDKNNVSETLKLVVAK